MNNPGSIFELNDDTSSLFNEVISEEQQQEENEYNSEGNSSSFSLFENDEETDTSDSQEEEELDDPEEGEGDEQPKPKTGKKKTTQEETSNTTSYGEVIQTLITDTDEFLVYEGEEQRGDYSKEEFVELFNANIDSKVNQYVESTLTNIVNSFSPSIQKIIKAELRGVKVKDIIDDIKEYEEISSLPTNPSEREKEAIVRKYYKELAKEKNKSDDWVNKTVERIVDTDDLDSEYTDAATHYEGKIQEKIEAKAKEKEDQKEATLRFKQHHSHVVNEILKEDQLFGIKLKKQDKAVIADVLAGFVVRNSDKKEKMKLTAIIDQLISDKSNPTESYKKLALMSLAAVNPEGMIATLSSNAETSVTQKTVKQLKVADKNIVSIPRQIQKTPKKIKSIFDN